MRGEVTKRKRLHLDDKCNKEERLKTLFIIKVDRVKLTAILRGFTNRPTRFHISGNWCLETDPVTKGK